MRTILRVGWSLVVLTAALLVSGCIATPTAQVRRPQLSDYVIRVVKSSSNREHSQQELERLRNDVIQYLEGQRLAPQDSYLVEITLAPDASGAPGETLVVQLVNVPANSYRLLAAAPYSPPLEDYPYNSGYGYSSSYAPSFLYGYYDPFDSYYGGGSYPYSPLGGHLPRPNRPNDGPHAPGKGEPRTAGNNYPHRPTDGNDPRQPGDDDHRPTANGHGPPGDVNHRTPGKDEPRTAGNNPPRRPTGGGNPPRTPGDIDHRTPPPRPATRHDDLPSRPRPEFTGNGDSGRRDGGAGFSSAPPANFPSPSSSRMDTYSPPPPPPPVREAEPSPRVRENVTNPNSDRTVEK